MWDRGQKLKRSWSWLILDWRPFRHCKHFTVTVELLYLNQPSQILGFSEAHTPATVSTLKKGSCTWRLGWLIVSGVAAWLTRASGQKPKVCRQEGDMAGGLTWAGTRASGQDGHAAQGMQNLGSGISPRNLTTSVNDRAEKT